MSKKHKPTVLFKSKKGEGAYLIKVTPPKKNKLTDIQSRWYKWSLQYQRTVLDYQLQALITDLKKDGFAIEVLTWNHVQNEPALYCL